MKTWVASTAVVVKDKARSKRFFRDKIGLKVLMEEGHWLTVGDPKRGSALHLCEVRDFDKKAPLEKGNTGILLLVDTDVRKAYAAMKKKGVKFAGKPVEHPWGWDFTFKDPDGNEFLVMGG